MPNTISTEELQNLIASADQTKPIFLVKLSPLHDCGWATFESSTDEQVWVPCTVSEERYSLAENYKITLVPTLKGFGVQHWYQCDFTLMLKSASAIVLNQAIAWQSQVPDLPGLSLWQRFTNVKTALLRGLKNQSQLARPRH